MSSRRPVETQMERVELLGRTFYIRKDGPSYLFPIDMENWDNMDIWHEFFLKMRNDHPWSAPVPINREGGLKIVDFGCGPGTWTMYTSLYLEDKSTEEPIVVGIDAQIMGIDIINQAPLMIPGNVYFNEMDINGPWPIGAEPNVDLIYTRRMNGAIGSWAEFYAKSFKMLKPQDGWIEHIEIDFEPRCDEKPVPPDLKAIFDEFASGMAEGGFSTKIDSDAMKGWLQAAGFVDINEECLLVPVSEWSGEGKYSENDMNRYMHLALTNDMDGILTGPLMVVKGRSASEMQDILGKAIHDITEATNRVYMRVYTWTARKPGQ